MGFGLDRGLIEHDLLDLLSGNAVIGDVLSSILIVPFQLNDSHSTT
ncbi:MAG TPA: hypothetical protein VFF07_02980 [Actinomycetota bacterium]|nr:hypothetical protein [Actinomycetota bacterium]